MIHDQEFVWIAVDLDQTLAEGAWDPVTNCSDIGAPIEENVAKLREVAAAGYKIVIYTARPWDHHAGIERWLDHHEIPWRRIVCGKLNVLLFIDDKARSADAESWLP